MRNCREKGFGNIGVFVFLTILAVFGLSVFFVKTNPREIITSTPAPSPSDEPSFKEFSDTELGIKFGFPEIFEIAKIFVEGDKDKIQTVELRYGNPQEVFMSLSYYPNPNNMSLEMLEKDLTSRESDLKSPQFVSDKNKAVFVGRGIKAIYQAQFICEPSVCERYLIPARDKVYDLILFPSNITDQEKVKKKILESVRIIS